MFRPDPRLEPACVRPRLICESNFMDDRRQDAMTTRPIEDLRRCDLSGRRTRFVLVNDRVPRADANCALCRTKIERGYVRDPQTRMAYCDAQCFTDREKMAMPTIVDHTRRVS